jgi:hypothetical protein
MEGGNMRKSIFVPAVREELVRRLERLGPTSERLWGEMSVDQVLPHLADQLRIALGEIRVAPIPNPYSHGLRRFLAIHVLPWPKSAPTHPAFFTASPTDLAADRATLTALVDEVAKRGPAGPWHPHPMFAHLSGRSWGVLMARHLDHHLRQFSC